VATFGMTTYYFNCFYYSDTSY